MLKIIRSKEAG